MLTGGAKFTDTEREILLEKVAKMDRRGYTQRQIGDELGVSQPMVSEYLKWIRERYKTYQMESREINVAEKLAQYREMRMEAWTAWERSKEDIVREIEDDTTTETSSKIKTVRMIEGRLPSNEYLTTIIKCLTKEEELMGLTQTQAPINILTIDYDSLMERSSQVNKIEQAILNVANAKQELGYSPLKPLLNTSEEPTFNGHI